jgi:hypothetical protein
VGKGIGAVATNTVVGNGAMAATATGGNNTAVGYQALNANTTAVSNTALGYQSLRLSTTGGLNTAIGQSALASNTTGDSNTAIGYEALLNSTTSQYNVAVGRSALKTNTTGYGNTAFGLSSLGLNLGGYYNVGIGGGSGYFISSGATNTCIGYNAGASGTNNLTTGSNNTIIGYNAAASSATVSNEVTIGNSSVTTTRLQGNLGVAGTQPAAWGTSTSAIDMNFAGLSFDSTSGGVYLSSNLYESSTSPTTWNVKTNASPNSSYYAQVGGLHSWVYAAPAAIGSAVTLIPQMSLATTGVLNIGNQSTAGISLNSIQASGGSANINFCLVSAGTATGSITALREGGSFATSLILSTAVGGGTVTEALRINSSQNVGIGLTPNANTKLDVNGPIRAKGYTVATLPTGVVGARAYVTDALAPTFLTALTGGGAVTTPAFYNGTAWVAG